MAGQVGGGGRSGLLLLLGSLWLLGLLGSCRSLPEAPLPPEAAAPLPDSPARVEPDLEPAPPSQPPPSAPPPLPATFDGSEKRSFGDRALESSSLGRLAGGQEILFWNLPGRESSTLLLSLGPGAGAGAGDKGATGALALALALLSREIAGLRGPGAEQGLPPMGIKLSDLGGGVLCLSFEIPDRPPAWLPDRLGPLLARPGFLDRAPDEEVLASLLRSLRMGELIRRRGTSPSPALGTAAGLASTSLEAARAAWLGSGGGAELRVLLAGDLGGEGVFLPSSPAPSRPERAAASLSLEAVGGGLRLELGQSPFSAREAGALALLASLIDEERGTALRPWSLGPEGPVLEFAQAGIAAGEGELPRALADRLRDLAGELEGGGVELEGRLRRLRVGSILTLAGGGQGQALLWELARHQAGGGDAGDFFAFESGMEAADSAALARAARLLALELEERAPQR